MSLVKRWIAGAIMTVVMGVFSLGAYDFITQAMVRGVPIAEFGLAGWTQSFIDRGRAAAERARRAARRDGPLNTYFPDAPAGWEQVAWTPAHDDLLKRDTQGMGDFERDLMADLEADPRFSALKAVDGAMGTVRGYAEARRATVYLRGTQFITLKARFLDTGGGGLFAVLGQQIRGVDGQGAGSRGGAVAVHGGTAFRSFGRSDRSATNVRRLKGVLDDQIEITVRTNAPQSQVNRVLSRIRYKDLWALLGDAPGGDVAKRQRELSAEMRTRQREARHAQQRERAQIEERLDRAVRSARSSGKQEACISHNGVQYCRWVN